MWCREGNARTHYMRMPGVRKDKDADLGFRQDGSESNKRSKTEQYCGRWYGDSTAE